MKNFVFDRDQFLSQLEIDRSWDIIIIGGGATGAGIALDAASRGYHTVLLEQSDFGKGTSSRSTKLIHGGVRYLEQGDIKLVTAALRERQRLIQNAPHLVHDLSFVIPTYRWWEKFYFSLGLKLYDWLAGRQSFGHSQLISSEETRKHLPFLQSRQLRGGVLYHDGQFDDARLVINLLQTAAQHSAVTINYCRVESLQKNADHLIKGVVCRDQETGKSYELSGKCVINATGPFSDEVRSLDNPDQRSLILPSRGAHVVVDGRFLGSQTAMLVPRTSDGRVMFAIPWHGHCVLGTTDTPVEQARLEPQVTDEEIDFILETAGRYFDPAPARQDILSTFAGIRPLINSKGTSNSSKVSREHAIEVSASGLITIAGGKWTTYRQMAQDCVDQAAQVAKLTPKSCITANLPLHGSMGSDSAMNSTQKGSWDTLGADRAGIDSLVDSHADWGVPLNENDTLTKAEVVWSVHFEMARSIEDVLSRRHRLLLLNATVAKSLAGPVAEIMAEELGRDTVWISAQITDFCDLADQYLPVD